eukprot:TRINITY_DN60_c0_g1_i1.p1 TRINITY_DN60_c0_g1~~TRINITY_DN60_c0_g1_i1.p1  ORF type:complete len:266 (+),score=18.77 TRINITY_DN60_c0_g1_i1:27-800(+)
MNLLLSLSLVVVVSGAHHIGLNEYNWPFSFNAVAFSGAHHQWQMQLATPMARTVCDTGPHTSYLYQKESYNGGCAAWFTTETWLSPTTLKLTGNGDDGVNRIALINFQCGAAFNLRQDEAPIRTYNFNITTPLACGGTPPPPPPPPAKNLTSSHDLEAIQLGGGLFRVQNRTTSSYTLPYSEASAACAAFRFKLTTLTYLNSHPHLAECRCMWVVGGNAYFVWHANSTCNHKGATKGLNQCPGSSATFEHYDVACHY